MSGKKYLRAYNLWMEKAHKQSLIQRGRGRPSVIDGAVVNVNLRMGAEDRETLRQVGGAAWLRAQLAAVRKNTQMAKNLHK